MGEQVAQVQSDCGEEGALIEQLTNLARRIRERLADQCEAEGVSASRFAILQAIAGADGEGCSQTELAARLELSESNVCSLIERMRTVGLLFRFRSKTDRRKSVLMLSERGKQLAETVSRAQHLETASLLRALDADQRSELRSLLNRLHQQLETCPQVVVAPQDTDDVPRWESSSLEATEAFAEAEVVAKRAS